MVKPELHALFEALYTEYGPQNWWPAKTRVEMILGAILTQNTAWTHVEKALDNLRKNRALNFKMLEQTSHTQITEWIRPAGHFNQKTDYLKAFAHMLSKEHNGSIDHLFRLDTPILRKQLLDTKGIGPETADSILLYAACRPVFVVDTYTRRLLDHIGYKEEANAPYDRIAQLFTTALPLDVPLYNEYHALIVYWGKHHPKKKEKTT